MGGSRGSLWTKLRNVFIIFLVSGFWHGANWTFIVWGALNALYFLPLLLLQNNRNHLDIVARGKLLPSIKDFFLILITFILTLIAWIFFRAENIGHALKFISDMFSPSIFALPEIRPKTLIVLVLVFFAIEWIGRENQYEIGRASCRERV